MKLKILVPVALLAALVGLAIGGSFRVGDGEVALTRGAGDAVDRVFDPGRHWRWPGTPLLRLPTVPVEMRQPVEVTTAQGATVWIAIDGAFGVEPERAGEWAAGTGWRPFFDGLGLIAARELEPEVQRDAPEEVFAPGAEIRFAERLRTGLEAAGARIGRLQVRLPLDRNPVVAAGLRARVARLGRPTGRQVLVIGWDGADWLMIEPLLAAGQLPNLRRLVERGVAGELRSEKPLLSPLVWTTIATGKPVLEHGIADFLVQDDATGALVPISSEARKVQALWTILTAFRLRADVVAWWATWPAEQILGTMVTDRVAYQLFEVADVANEGKVHPVSAWPRVEEKLVGAEELPWSTVQRYVDVPAAELAQRWEALPADRRQEDKLNHLRKILATTDSYHAIGLDLLRNQADLTLLYYEGTDTVAHLFARYLPPQLPGVSEEEVRRFGGALPAFYQRADELLGEVLAAADPDTTVLLVSDHGFFTGAARPASDPSDFTAGAPQWHRQSGVLVAAGPGIRPGRVADASIFDVTPTVLALLGLPVPGDMPGRVLPEIVSSPAPETRLASYEILPPLSPKAAPRQSGAMDEERLRQLVALGYVSASVLDRAQGGEATPSPAPTPATPPPDGPGAAGPTQSDVFTQAYNRGRILQNAGDLAGAREQYRLAIETEPTFGQGYASLAQVASIEGDHAQAFHTLVEGFRRSNDMPSSAITGLVDEAAPAGLLAEAEQVLEAIRPALRGLSAYHAAWGYLREKQGRGDEALASYRAALEINPLDELANEQQVSILRRLGRVQEARQALEQAFSRSGGDMAAMNLLAVVALRQGWPDLAEGYLRRVLESDPGNPGVLANLAGTLRQQGRIDEALATMAEAVRREPGDARNQFNLGAMLADAGRSAEALTAFEAAIAQGLRGPSVYVAASKMHFRLGQTAQAEQLLLEALKVAPGDPEATQLLQILRQGR